ncbi:MAG: DrmE family protein [Clostridia bacterium]
MTETLYRMQKIIEKCDLLYNGELISKEYLMQVYAEFVTSTFNEGKHNVGVVLHTGSICFDIVSVIISALSVIYFCKTDVNDVIESLQIDDMVIYSRQRAVFKGVTIINNEEFIILEQVKMDHGYESICTIKVPIKIASKISPYNGDSIRTDSRGIRRGNSIRIDFISSVFDMEKSKIPSVFYTSVVLVMKREIADDIINNLTIKYEGNKTVKFLDIFSVSYYTEHDQYQYGGNPGRIEPVIKITNKISVARDLILDKDSNQIIGLVVLEYECINRGRSELIELMNRKSLKFVLVSIGYDSEDTISIINECDNTSLFACTKDFLLSFSKPVIYVNEYTKELDKQVENIFNRKIELNIVKSNKTWNDYYELKKALFLIRKSEIQGIDRDNFIIYAYSLLNLFVTAVFSIEIMEDLIKDEKLNTISPQKKIDNLWKISKNFNGILLEKAEYVLNQLEFLYLENIATCLKGEALKKYLSENINKKIALIIPKNYYGVILDSNFMKYDLNTSGNLMISTANKFDNSIFYDEIFIIGDFKGKRFDAYKCRASSKIILMIYDFEANNIIYKIKASRDLENFYNQKNKISVEQDEMPFDVDYDNIVEISSEIGEMEDISADLSQYINQIESLSEINMINHYSNGSASVKVDVVMVGTFTGGEKVFFTKKYKAYVFDGKKEEVSEVEIDSLTSGNILVFTKNDTFTKDIVDDILRTLMDTNALSIEQKVSYRMSKHWKKALQEYMIINEVTFRNVSKKLKELGCEKHEVTIRSWLDEDSHIVGPIEEDSFTHMANLIKDEEMLADPIEFCNACKVIRKVRVRILKLIALSIINKLRGQLPKNDILFETVFDKVDDLAELLQLETITELEQILQIPVSKANHPILI